MLTSIEKELLKDVSLYHNIKQGALNIRRNGETVERKVTENIIIEPNKENNGLKVIIAPNTKNESVHMPVIISKSGITDSVVNEFIIGENADVLIVAGCGVHASGKGDSSHSGLHKFYLKKGAKVKYIEKHIAGGNDIASKEISPITEIVLEDDAHFMVETAQLGGVTKAIRKTYATLFKGASLDIKESLLTTNSDYAETIFTANLKGENSKCNIVSRAVAKGESKQIFKSVVVGENKCFSHTACDAIIMDNAKVISAPEVDAYSKEAELIHEAAIGKIAGEQILKLMTLGYTEEEAQNAIIKGFLK